MHVSAASSAQAIYFFAGAEFSSEEQSVEGLSQLREVRAADPGKGKGKGKDKGLKKKDKKKRKGKNLRKSDKKDAGKKSAKKNPRTPSLTVFQPRRAVSSGGLGLQIGRAVAGAINFPFTRW